MEPVYKPHYVLKIDAHAYSVALTIARLAGRQECMFLLLGEAGPNIVRHVLLLPDQQVTPGSCNITARSMSMAIDEIEQLNAVHQPKWVVLGWGHSHGFLDTFHSATDVCTSDDITAQIGFANRWVCEEPLSVRLTETGDLCVALGKSGDEVALCMADPALARRIAARDVPAVRRVSMGFAYSLVVNARGDTYAEVITQPPGVAEGGDQPMQRHTALVQVLPEPLDETALRQEIERKLRTVVVPPALPPPQTIVRPATGLAHLCRVALRRLR